MVFLVPCCHFSPKILQTKKNTFFVKHFIKNQYNNIKNITRMEWSNKNNLTLEQET